jgi:hypothetical protein
LKGYKAAFGSNVRFVLTGHSEVSQSTLGRWFLVHSVVITLGIVGLLVAGVVLGRRRAGRRRQPVPDLEQAAPPPPLP